MNIYKWSGKGWAITLYVHMDVISSIYNIYSYIFGHLPSLVFLNKISEALAKKMLFEAVLLCLLFIGFSSLLLNDVKIGTMKNCFKKVKRGLASSSIRAPIMISQQRVPKEMQWLLRKRMAQTKGKKGISSEEDLFFKKSYIAPLKVWFNTVLPSVLKKVFRIANYYHPLNHSSIQIINIWCIFHGFIAKVGNTGFDIKCICVQM